MGTRADFYVGKGKNAEWIGSIAMDGYRDGIDPPVIGASSEADFRAAVTQFFSARDDVTLPADGWPWPWKTSETTDCSYWFFEGQVWEEVHGTYLSCQKPEPETQEECDEAVADGEAIEFPEFEIGSAALSGKRSGIIVVGFSDDGKLSVV